MCLGLQCPGARDGFVITRLLFQGRVFDHDTDDLIIFLRHPLTGQIAKQCLQMKRSLKPTNNKIFNEAVGLAWLDFSKPNFQRNLDELLIVYYAASITSMQGAVEVVRHAMVSSSAEDWHVRVHAESFSNESNRKAYAAIKHAVELQKGSEVDKVELYPFVLHLKFMPHDLDSDRSIEVDNQKQLISQRIFSRQSSDVWATLQAVCAELNSSAGQICEETAERHLGALVLEFQLTRLIWNGFHAGQGAGLDGATGRLTSALPLSPEVQSQIAEILKPNRSNGAVVQDVFVTDDLPSGSAASDNSFISRQLDRITEGQREHRYKDSLGQLNLLESDLDDFDAHQKARWYLLRGLSLWHVGNDEAAANDFDKAANLYDSDDRIAAAAVRARMLRNEGQAAVEIGRAMLERFPESYTVWAVATNARLLVGERLNENEIPSIFAEKAAAWQLVASSLGERGDDDAAVRVIRIALDKPDCSFFILESYLRYAIRLATVDEVRVNCRSLLPSHAEVLSDAMSRFDDRDNTIWSSQSPKVVSDVIAHLAYGMLLLQRPSEAIELIQQAKMKDIHFTDVITRVEVEAMCDLDRWADVTDRFQFAIDTLPDETLLRFGQACMAQSRPDLLQLARDEVARRKESDVAPRIAVMLRHIHWEMLLHDDATALRSELSDAGITPLSTSVIDLCFAAQAYKDDESLQNRYVDRIAELAPACTDPQELALGARAMLRAHRYENAIGLFEKLLPADAFTPLHIDLLHCYILTGRQAQALKLLESMPATWRDSPQAQEQALFLFNSVGDWARMRELVERTVCENRKNANAWLTLIRVAACEGVLDLDTLVSDMPHDLEGAPKDLLLLASIEMRHGQVEKGLNRIACIVRNNLGDVELAATHIQVMLTLSQEATQVMEKVHQVPAAVEPGASIELADEKGNLQRVSIDFADATPPSSGAEFIAPDSQFATRMMGLRVSETVSFDNLMGTQVLEIKHIMSLHQRLLELSHKLVRDSVVPSKSLVAMTIPTNANGEMDFSVFLQQLDRHQSRVADLLRLYEQNPLTLNLVASQLGRDIIDLVRDWPLDGPFLEVSTVAGTAHDILPCPLHASNWVVDLAMLTELAMFGLLDVLSHLSKVYVSTATRQALDMKIESSATLRKSGTIFAHEGQLGFHEETAQTHAREQAFLNSIDIAIASFCTVVPAYGPLQPAPELQRLRDILDREAHATLMLCKEYAAGLLSLDARLRQLASVLDVHSASPQMLLKGMADSGALRRVEYSCTLIKMIIAHRGFISVGIPDLVGMMDQGLAFSNAGIQSLRAYLAAPTVEFRSASFTIIGFIKQMHVSGRCTFAMMLELIMHLVEPLFRHPDCPSDFLDNSLKGFSSLSEYGLTDTHFELIKCSLICAKDDAQHPQQSSPLNAQIVYLRRAPLYSIEDEEALLARVVPVKSSIDESIISEQVAEQSDTQAADIVQERIASNTLGEAQARVKTADTEE